MSRFKIIIALTMLCAGGIFAIFAGTQRQSPVQHISSDIFADVVLVPDPELEDAILYLVFPAGEAANPYEEGLAHYVEHLAWLSAFGTSSDRHSNAWTNLFTTGYWHQNESGSLADNIKQLLQVAAPFSVDENFALEERDIVLREYDMRVGELPAYPVYRQLNQVLYGAGTLGRSVIGQSQDIAAYDLERARDLHRQSHDPATATLIVYGDITGTELESALDALPRSEAPPSSLAPVSLIDEEPFSDRAMISVAGLSEPLFVYYKLVPLSGCDDQAQCALLVDFVESALGAAMPGGLAVPLRFDNFIARTFQVTLDVVAGEYLRFGFEANPDLGVELDVLERAFHEALENTIKNGLSETTFERLKARLDRRWLELPDDERPRMNLGIVLEQVGAGQPAMSRQDIVLALNNLQREDVNKILKLLSLNGREVTRLLSIKDDLND